MRHMQACMPRIYVYFPLANIEFSWHSRKLQTPGNKSPSVDLARLKSPIRLLNKSQCQNPNSSTNRSRNPFVYRRRFHVDDNWIRAWLLSYLRAVRATSLQSEQIHNVYGEREKLSALTLKMMYK